MGTVLDHHIAAAFLADHIRHFIFYGHAFLFLLRHLDRLVQIRIEVADDLLPGHPALLHHIQKPFHIGRKMDIHDTREGLLHDVVDHLSDLRQIEVLSFLGDVPPSQDRADGGRIGTGTPDPLLLQRLHQRRLCIMSRRLGKVLLRLEVLPGELGVLLQSAYQHVAFFLFLVRFHIYGAEAFKCHPGRGDGKDILSCPDPDRSGLESGRLHPACRKPLPDQLVQPELVPGQGILQGCRSPCDIRRTDGFMGILDLLLGLLRRAAGRGILFPVGPGDVLPCRRVRLVRDPGGVGTQISDHTHGSVSLDIDSFI